MIGKPSRRKRVTKDYKNISLKNNEKKGWLSGLFSKKGGNSEKFETKKVYKDFNFKKKNTEIKSKSIFNKNNSKTSKAKNENENNSLIHYFLYFFGFFFSLFIKPILFIIKPIINTIEVKLDRGLALGLAFVMAFSYISFRFAVMQVDGVAETVEETKVGQVLGIQGTENKIDYKISNIVSPIRGQIYMKDAKTGNVVTLTNTQYSYHVWFDPYALREQVTKNTITLDEAISDISASLNLPYPEIEKKFKEEIEKEKPGRYVILKKFISEEQKLAVQELRKTNTTNENARNYNKLYSSWIDIETVENRSYPEGKIFSSGVGYVQNFPITMEETLNIRGCSEAVERDIDKGVKNAQYRVGRYGLEEKYCSVLLGTHGRSLNLDVGNGDEELAKKDGGSLYLTIDRDMQVKAEDILEKAVKNSTNANGGPENGAILIMNTETGNIVASASYPYFDPNKYSEEFAKNPRAFMHAPALNYEIGSVMKPLTVLASLNEYYSGRMKEDSETRRMVRAGTPPDWTTTAYDHQGKIYREIDGTEYAITNANGETFQDLPRIGLKETLRDSINTGIADIVPTVGTLKFKEYLEEKYMFGKPTLTDFPGSGSPIISGFDQIYCPFCYANLGYGQGFSVSMIDLARAYSAIGNEGRIVEPRIVEKIVYQDGSVDDGTAENSLIKQPKPIQIVDKRAADYTLQIMTEGVEEGYKGRGAGSSRLTNYLVATKSGTAQVNRPIEKKDAEGNVILDENGDPVLVPCDYKCNTKRGIYDHTFVGIGPSKDPKFIIILKLSEPNPGQRENYATKSLAPFFNEMASFTFEYYNLPKDR